MTSQFTPLTFVLLVFFIVVVLWNTWILWRLMHRSKRNVGSIQDEKYFDLKYNMQLMIAIFSIVVSVATAMGYTSLNNVKEELRKELTNSIDSLNNRLTTINSTAANIESFLSETEKITVQVDLLQGKVKSINEKNILKQNYYIVTSLKFIVKDPSEHRTINFKDLKTNLGDRLPNFTTPPLIITVPDETIPVQVFDITNNSFSVTPYGVQVGERDPFDGKPIVFSILILEK